MSETNVISVSEMKESKENGNYLKYAGIVVLLAVFLGVSYASAETVITDFQMIVGNVTIGPDEITLGSSAGTPVLNVDGTDGKVGIGTSDPSETLEVNGNTKIDGDLEVTGNLSISGGNSQPIGCVMAWLKSYQNTPPLSEGWVECNGQILNDVNSPYNGQVIPNLNGESRYLKGSSTSGATGGSLTHKHLTGNIPYKSYPYGLHFSEIRSGHLVLESDGDHNHGYTSAASSEPPYYEVVWIMKVK